MFCLKFNVYVHKVKSESFEPLAETAVFGGHVQLLPIAEWVTGGLYGRLSWQRGPLVVSAALKTHPAAARQTLRIPQPSWGPKEMPVLQRGTLWQLLQRFYNGTQLSKLPTYYMLLCHWHKHKYLRGLQTYHAFINPHLYFLFCDVSVGGALE